MDRSIEVLQSAVAKPEPRSQSTRVSVGQQTDHMVFRPSNFAADVAFSATVLRALVESWYRLKKWMFDPYRPELHYMRGPGPKWREKHAHRQQDSTSAYQDLRMTPAAIAASCADPCRSPNAKEEAGL